MPHQRCTPPHDLHVVIEPGRFERAAADYPDAPPPTYKTLDADLNATMNTGVPTFLHQGRDSDMLITFCTARYEIVCAPTHRGDGYYAIRLSPLSLRSHDQIARQALHIQPHHWVLHVDVSEMAYADAQSGFDTFCTAWETLPTSTTITAAPLDLTPDHARFLNHVETLIDLARDTELTKIAEQGATPVVSVSQMKANALTHHNYRLRLASPADFSVGDYIHAGGPNNVGNAGKTGVITTLSPSKRDVQVRFFEMVMWEQAQTIAWIMPAVSTKQYRIQKDAVRALREGQSHNPSVLPAIVEGWFDEYTAPATAIAVDNLNAAQRDMVTRAQSVPDLLLTLGPPGTGKTHSIRELVRQETAQGHKVLITSKNNKAVDNVLEALTDVDALRIGREAAVAANVRPLMIDQRASDLQTQILANTATQWDQIVALNVAWNNIQQKLTDINTALQTLGPAQNAVTKARAILRAWQQARYADVSPAIQRQNRRFHMAHNRAQKAVVAADALCTKLNRQARLCQLPWRHAEHLAAWEKLHAQWQIHVQQRQQAINEMETAASNIQRIWAAYHHTASASDTALKHKRAIVAAETALNDVHTRITQALAQAQTALSPFPEAPRWPDTLQPTPVTIQTWQQRLNTWHTTALASQNLLTEWRHLLESRPQILYPTLIQMADVVGATCIGVATDARFEDLTFDLMIADEAGQIQVMDLLVPLVRARRAILVGDDRQLPPMVEDELRAHLENEDTALLPWLEQSLFEQLFRQPSTPESRKVYLDTQYRMPKTIADFIGQQFYEARYHTGITIPHNDPFFESPLVFVNTQHERNRRERAAREGAGIRGYTNTLEAQVIADLVHAYQAQGTAQGNAAEWGVIVPYKKQAAHIRRELRRKGTWSDTELQESVATVDSFQGKERDIIIFGFTRSNPRGNVGFLAELRRLNVSLTRAKRQLILVGDVQTLTHARDADFAELMQALVNKVKTLPGGYLSIKDLRRLI